MNDIPYRNAARRLARILALVRTLHFASPSTPPTRHEVVRRFVELHPDELTIHGVRAAIDRAIGGGLLLSHDGGGLSLTDAGEIHADAHA